MRKLMPFAILLIPFVFIGVWIALFYCLQPLAMDYGMDKFISGFAAFMVTMYASMFIGFDYL